MPALLTTAEVAQRLGISRRRVGALIEAERLPARKAVAFELISLLEEGRIRSVPPAGVILIREEDLELIKDRPIGYPKGRPRNP